MFTIFALFYFVFEGNFKVQAARVGGGGCYIRRGDLTEVFFCVTILGSLYLEGLIFGILRYSIKLSLSPHKSPLATLTFLDSHCRFIEDTGRQPTVGKETWTPLSKTILN